MLMKLLLVGRGKLIDEVELKLWFCALKKNKVDFLTRVRTQNLDRSTRKFREKLPRCVVYGEHKVERLVQPAQSRARQKLVFGKEILPARGATQVMRNYNSYKLIWSSAQCMGWERNNWTGLAIGITLYWKWVCVYGKLWTKTSGYLVRSQWKLGSGLVWY